MRQEGIRLALAVVYLSSSVMALLGEAAASGDAPWVDGFYVPRDQVASCKEPNFEVYDWVLRFQKNRRSEMGTSDGICGVSNIVNVGRGLYQSQLDCDSRVKSPLRA